MIGFLITGHGDFAIGLNSSLTMIAGELEALEIVPFQENVDLEGFQNELKAALDALLDKSEGVVIFTDLLGGTPFRTAMMVASEYDNVEVLTGTNLPMLLEGTALRFTKDPQRLAEQLVESGKTGIENPRLELVVETEKEESFEGGI